MKTPARWIFLLVFSTGLLRADVAVGDTQEEVQAALGRPRGELNLSGRQILYFDRGRVELEGNRVTRVALVSHEVLAATQEREARRKEIREARRQQLIAEGTVLRDQKLADPTLRDAPVAYQVTYWESFAASYPDVSVVEPLTIARMRFNEQAQEKQRQEAESARQAALTEELAERSQTFYPLYVNTPYYGRRWHSISQPSFMPTEYTFFSTPLPPYTTPSGSPAGVLRGPLFNPPATNPATPPAFEAPRFNDRSWQPDHSRWRSRPVDRPRRDGM